MPFVFFFCPLPYGAIPINGIAQMSPVKLKGWHGKPPVSTSTRPRHSVKSVVVMSSYDLLFGYQ